MQEIPSLELLLSALCSLSGYSGPIDSQLKLAELPIESLAVVEWFLFVEDTFGVELDDEVLETAFDLSALELYEIVFGVNNDRVRDA